MCGLYRNYASLNLLEVNGRFWVSVRIASHLTYYPLLLANHLNTSGSMIHIDYVTKRHYAVDLLVQRKFVVCELKTEFLRTYVHYWGPRWHSD